MSIETSQNEMQREKEYNLKKKKEKGVRTSINLFGSTQFNPEHLVIKKLCYAWSGIVSFENRSILT